MCHQIKLIETKVRKMRTLSVKFEWTILIKISEARSTFRKVSTGIENFTFEEIGQIHARNYQGSGKVYRDYGYLTDDWGHYAHKMDMESLRKRLETYNAVFVVELDYPWLRFSPVIRTKKELIAFEKGVKACGSLD